MLLTGRLNKLLSCQSGHFSKLAFFVAQGRSFKTFRGNSVVDIVHNKKISSRSDLKNAERIVVKVGSAVVTEPANPSKMSHSRVTSLAEQLAQLKKSGKKPILVCSGAVSIGSKVLEQKDILANKDYGHLGRLFQVTPGSIQKMLSASVGQTSLTAAFSDLLAKENIEVAQILVTVEDLIDPKKRFMLSRILYELSEASHTIPVLNTNDSISPPSISKTTTLIEGGICIKDNDNLAAVLAKDVKADLLILLSNVDGVYTGNPNNKHSKFLRTITEKDLDLIEFSDNDPATNVGTGGMRSKAESSLWVVNSGCKVVIANGYKLNDSQVLTDIINGRLVGTFFTDTSSDASDITPRSAAEKAKLAQQNTLSVSTFEQRKQAVRLIADSISQNKKLLMEQNLLDIELYKQTLFNEAGEQEKQYEQLLKNKKALINRLYLTETKIQDLLLGLYQLAELKSDPMNNTLSQCLLDDGLLLKKVTVPLGSLMVVCEARPDVPPQVAALAVLTGNSLLLKAGKETTKSNETLAKLIKAAYKQVFGTDDIFHLLKNRSDVAELLELPEYIDLVIPRGSNEMVSQLQRDSVRIPVLGHSEGICHVFLDDSAKLDTAKRVVIDSKCDYPAACNSVETLLISRHWFDKRIDDLVSLCSSLHEKGVELVGGPQLFKLKEKYNNDGGAAGKFFGHFKSFTNQLAHEYGELKMTVEFVDTTSDAIAHINKYSSSHTDSIVSENTANVGEFLDKVDSSSVYHNASTRFADGYRYGLGAEVGISTTKIHARGPVGLEGLLSTKFKLFGNGQVVGEYKTGGGKKFIHKKL